MPSFVRFMLVATPVMMLLSHLGAVKSGTNLRFNAPYCLAYMDRPQLIGDCLSNLTGYMIACLSAAFILYLLSRAVFWLFTKGWWYLTHSL